MYSCIYMYTYAQLTFMRTATVVLLWRVRPGDFKSWSEGRTYMHAPRERETVQYSMQWVMGNG